MRPADVLILSSPQDVHYRAVHWALRRIGVESHLLFGNCFPESEAQTLLISDTELSYEGHVDGGESVNLLAPAVIWYRRGHWPITAAELSQADTEAANREAEMFIGGVRSVAAGEQRWINDPDREAVANRKPYQLHVAKRLGMTIPRTIMSNDPAKISAFFESCEGDVIFKPFRAIQWVTSQQHLILFARKLRFEDIEDPAALAFTSHLFQQYVQKRYELRVFCFGTRLIAVKLNSQTDPSTQTDWRTSTNGMLQPELCDLPQKTADSVLRYMTHMGLEYGAFDFVVRPDGEHVFLECNVSGQFLFVEEWNPQIQMLAAFVRFLTRDLDLKPKQRKAIDALRYLDFYHSAETVAYYEGVSARFPRGHTSQNVHHEEPVG